MMGWQGVKFYDFALTCIVILTTLTLLWMCEQQYHCEMKFVADLNNNNNIRFTALCQGLLGRGSTRRNIYPPTILIIIQSLSASSIYQHPPCSNHVFGNFFVQPLSTSSLVYLLVWSPPYSIHFFTQSLSSFRNMCPYHRNLFCCSMKIISPIPSLSLNSLLRTLSFTLTLHIHLTILISACWIAALFSFLTGQLLLLCSILLRTQLLYSLPHRVDIAV